MFIFTVENGRNYTFLEKHEKKNRVWNISITIKRIKYLVIKGDSALSGKHSEQYTDNIS